MSNKKNYKRKGAIDQGSYALHPHVKRVAIGKAVINVKKEDQINYNVFKCGMHAIDLFKVQQDIAKDVGKRVCAELGDECKPPYIKSLYADSNGIMPPHLIINLIGPAPVPYTGANAAHYKDSKGPLVENWTKDYRKYKDDLAQMKVHIFDTYLSEDYKIILEDDPMYNDEIKNSKSLTEYMEVLLKWVKRLLKWSNDIEINEMNILMKELKIRDCLCATKYIAYLKKLKMKLVNLKTMKEMAGIPLPDLKVIHPLDANATAHDIEISVLNSTFNESVQSTYDNLINRIKINVEKEVNENQELISAIYKEFTKYGIDSAYASEFDVRKLKMKCPVGKEDATPFDIRYGGDGLNALLNEAAEITRALKEGRPGHNVYYIENSYEKPFKVVKEEVNISALVDQGAVIAALKKENTHLRAAVAAAGDKATPKKCSFCMEKLFRRKVNHTDAQCFHIVGNKGFIGEAEVNKKIKRAKEWKDKLVEEGKWRT